MRNPGLPRKRARIWHDRKKKYVINPRKQIPHFHYYLLGYHFRDGNNIEIYPSNLNLCCFLKFEFLSLTFISMTSFRNFDTGYHLQKNGALSPHDEKLYKNTTIYINSVYANMSQFQLRFVLNQLTE